MRRLRDQARQVLESEAVANWILTATLPWWQITGMALYVLGGAVATVTTSVAACAVSAGGGLFFAVPRLIDHYKIGKARS